jgi:uncharacterized protein (TIGR02147 family)
MNIFEEADYKKILKHLVEEQGKAARGIYRKMADHLRVNPSLISQVLSGPKDFTEEQIIFVCEFLGLAKLESRYLLTLVQLARAGSVALKNMHEESLEEIRKKALSLAHRVPKVKTLSEAEKIQFYSSWAYAAVQLCATLEKPQRFADICERLHLNRSEAKAILDFLLKSGMVVEERGVYKPGPSHTHLEKSSPHIVNLHKNWRLKAIERAGRLSEEELMYSCSFSVSRKDFAVIREEFMRSIQKFITTATNSPAEELAQVNVDLFWMRG